MLIIEMQNQAFIFSFLKSQTEGPILGLALAFIWFVMSKISKLKPKYLQICVKIADIIHRLRHFRQFYETQTFKFTSLCMNISQNMEIWLPTSFWLNLVSKLLRGRKSKCSMEWKFLRRHQKYVKVVYKCNDSEIPLQPKNFYIFLYMFLFSFIPLSYLYPCDLHLTNSVCFSFSLCRMGQTIFWMLWASLWF